MPIERRTFGRTGHQSSAILFGAAALGRVEQGVADEVLALLLEHGVNHIDVAASYGDAELRVGRWMDRHRGDFFLATKTKERGYAEAKAEMQRSLERLRTDQVDLIQLHGLVHPDEWEQALSSGGALDAAIEFKVAGHTRFIGVTGHGWTAPAMHRRSLERFPFDSILMPWNWHVAQRPGYRADFEETLEICRARNVAVQTIKALARGPWAAGATRDYATWYQPLEREDDIRTAVHWVLEEPDVFLNSVGDVGLLPLLLKVAGEERAPVSEAAMQQLDERAGLSSIFGL